MIPPCIAAILQPCADGCLHWRLPQNADIVLLPTLRCVPLQTLRSKSVLAAGAVRTMRTVMLRALQSAGHVSGAPHRWLGHMPLSACAGSLSPALSSSCKTPLHPGSLPAEAWVDLLRAAVTSSPQMRGHPSKVARRCAHAACEYA